MSRSARISLRSRSLVFSVGVAALALIMGAGVAVNATVTLLVLAVVLAIGIVAWRPRLAIYATLVLSLISVPDVIPMSFSVSGYTVQFYEPLLILALIYTLARLKADRVSNLRVMVLLLLFPLWGLVGLIAGNPMSRVLFDMRMFIDLPIAFVVASRVARIESVRRVSLSILPVILWTSAGFTVLASIFHFGLAGMQSDATGSTDEAARLISPATYPAVAVLCGVLALTISGKMGLSASRNYWIPSLILVFLSLTRNVLIAVAVAAVFALIASRSSRSSGRLVTYLVGIVGVSVVVYLLASSLTSIAVFAWLDDQLNAFGSRVLGGISSQALAKDGSAQFRFEQEDAYLVPQIWNSPIWGHGFGFAYKPLLTGRALNDKSTNLQYYAHNFYLWILVKSGVAGLALFVVSVCLPPLRLIRRFDPISLATGAATLGLLASSFVAPMPLGTPTALLLGVVAGACSTTWFEKESHAISTEFSKNRSSLQRSGAFRNMSDGRSI